MPSNLVNIGSFSFRDLFGNSVSLLLLPKSYYFSLLIINLPVYYMGCNILLIKLSFTSRTHDDN